MSLFDAHVLVCMPLVDGENRCSAHPASITASLQTLAHLCQLLTSEAPAPLLGFLKVCLSVWVSGWVGVMSVWVMVCRSELVW